MLGIKDEMQPNDPDAYAKAIEILAEKFPERVNRLNPERMAGETMAAIRSALSAEFGSEKADNIAFHMSDWNGDAAFILALHLFPERFTKDEIDEGIRSFLIHAPNHIAAAAKLFGLSVHEIFKEDE